MGTGTTVLEGQPVEDLHRLGEELEACAQEVLELTVARTAGPDHNVDAAVQDNFERLARPS